MSDHDALTGTVGTTVLENRAMIDVEIVEAKHVVIIRPPEFSKSSRNNGSFTRNSADRISQPSLRKSNAKTFGAPMQDNGG